VTTDDSASCDISRLVCLLQTRCWGC